MGGSVESYYLGLGSNVGDRLGHLRGAVRALSAQPALCVVHASPVYASPAHTLDPDERPPDFLNAVVKICTALPAADVLGITRSIEREAGRDPDAVPWAPRTLDIDVLAAGDAVLHAKHLTVPHPRIAERRFVLAPWAAIAPAYRVPAPFDATVAELLAACEDPGKVVRLPDRLLD